VDLVSADEKMVVQQSKGGLVGIIVIMVALVSAGVWLLTADFGSDVHSPAYYRVIGALGVLVGAVFIVASARKLLDSRPGLVVGPEGIFHNVTGNPVGLIPWQDIQGFVDCPGIYEGRILVIKVVDPDRYRRMGSPVARVLGAGNTPVSVPSGALKIDFDQLKETCVESYKRYGGRGAE
jgi:hypothetical protein